MDIKERENKILIEVNAGATSTKSKRQFKRFSR